MQADFNPIAHQDLINSNIGMLPQFGTGIYYTNMLHGARLQPQPDSDKFVLMKKKDKEDATSTALLFKGRINFKGFGNSVKALGKGGKSIGNVILAPFMWLGKGILAAGRGIGKAGKAVGKGILAPFKWLGKGIGAAGRGIGKAGKAVGKGILAPFKWLGKGIGAAGRGIGKAGKAVGKGILAPFKLHLNG